MVQFVRNMSEKRETRFQTLRNRHRFGDAKVRRVGSRAKRSDSENLDSLEQTQRRFGDLVGVGAIGEVSDPKPKHIEVFPMPHRDRNHRDAHDLKWVNVDGAELKPGNRSRMGRHTVGEGVVERLSDSLLDASLAIQRHRATKLKREQSKVIQPEYVVGVLVRVDNGMNDRDFFSQQLCTQIRRGVNQQVPLGQLEDDRASSPLVARMIATTNLTGTPQGGDTDAGPSAQKYNAGPRFRRGWRSFRRGWVCFRRCWV